MRRRRTAPAFAFIVLLAAALGLAACGGGESDESKITSAIETAATSTDPASCEETQTLAFMEQAKSGTGKEAVKECEKDTEEGKGNPESVDVSEVEAEGEEATATVVFHGGSYDGQSVEVSLVEEEGDWKLDEITGFAKFDRGKLIAGLEGALEEAQEENENVTPQLAGCVLEGVEELSDSELEELVISGAQQGVAEIAEECAQ